MRPLRLPSERHNLAVLAPREARGDPLAHNFAERADGVIAIADPVTLQHSRAFVELMQKYRLPAIYWTREYVEDGGLMSYSANLVEVRRRAAGYVDKILKGARPGELPVEQPAKVELVINLKAAKALGLTLPPALRLRADATIE